MLPADLNAASFAGYPPGARARAVEHVATLQQLPLSFLPSLLRELIDYDLRFPAERASLERELAALERLTAAQREEWFHGFAQLKLSAALERMNWVQRPAEFVEQESAYLWTTHQLDAFREAATAYGARLQQTAAPSRPSLGICVIGQGVHAYSGTLFRQLAAHGTIFTQVDPGDGLRTLMDVVAERAQATPRAYAHWYIDGGVAEVASPKVTCVSYAALAPMRTRLLHFMQAQAAQPGMGPEELRSRMARLTPGELGESVAEDAVLERFQLKVLTEGSGTQIFSTTFAQWAAREALRRAQPETLLLRFAPRQQQRSMEELLAARGETVALDPLGSLIDADMGAYYTWLNMRRLTGERLGFLVWFEGHGQAIALGPGLPRGTTSATPTSVRKLVGLVT